MLIVFSLILVCLLFFLIEICTPRINTLDTPEVPKIQSGAKIPKLSSRRK